MGRRKGTESRTIVLSVRIPPYLRQRLDEYATRFNISLTDATILKLQHGFGDQRGITLNASQRGRLHLNADGSHTLVAPRRSQQPARCEPNHPMPDPFDDDDNDQVDALAPKEKQDD